jgi:competence ComEA-like helix-hairpin-helix protein
MQAVVKKSIVAAIGALILSAVFSCRADKQQIGQDAATTSAAGTDADKPTAGDERACIDLNSATADELMMLPGVGKVTAAKIIEFRERHGPFRRPQDIIIIHGLSERKYRKLADFVCAR